jgi:hypothetical protein
LAHVGQDRLNPGRIPVSNLDMIRTLLAGLACAACAMAVHAQASDPLHSQECAAARSALDDALNDAVAQRDGARARLAQARKNAGLACLGRSQGNAQRSGAPEPAQAMPLSRMAAAPPEPPPVVVSPPSPPLVIPRAATVTACDPAGCWDSEGRRLNNVGPLLMGPHGFCSVQGGAVQCP